MISAQEERSNVVSLSISVWQYQANCLCHIQDTGSGLFDEAWDTLFQPFATFGKRNGLGLGLAFSRQTVVDHGGDLWADKECRSGALFYLRLPTPVSPDGRSVERSLEPEQKTS